MDGLGKGNAVHEGQLVNHLWNTRLGPLAGDFHVALGCAVAAMAKSDEYCQYPIACVTLWVEPAILHRQIHFFRAPSGEICGYMTWAWLAEDTEWRLLHDPNVLLHISEWNEGGRLWILDFLVHAGDVRTWIREAKALFGDIREARSMRRGEDGNIQKVTTWKRRLSQGISRPRK